MQFEKKKNFFLIRISIFSCPSHLEFDCPNLHRVTCVIFHLNNIEWFFFFHWFHFVSEHQWFNAIGGEFGIAAKKWHMCRWWKNIRLHWTQMVSDYQFSISAIFSIINWTWFQKCKKQIVGNIWYEIGRKHHSQLHCFWLVC